MSYRSAKRALGLLVALAAPAAAPAGPLAATPDDYAALARQIAAPWPGLQRGDGTFREYVPGRDPRNAKDYGEAMLGYGLIQTGIREGDSALIDAGINAVTRDAEIRDADEPVRMFRNMAVASAYNLLRKHLGDHPGFARVRGTWERRLRQVRVSRLQPGRRLTNKALVEAVLVLELDRSGLSSSDRRTVLGDRARSVRLVMRLLQGRLPRSRGAAGRGDAPAARLTLVGDAPDFPLAYHALSAGFLARAIELLGPRAPASASRLLRESAAASWALAGPDGDVAYTGRSQEQIWALSLTAHAAEVARTGAEPAAVANLAALADRTLARIDRDHRGGPAKFAITPALGDSVAGGRRGLDRYASAVQYTGLGLVGLNWARDAARGGPAGETAADRQGSFVLGRAGSRFATVRAGDIWFAVRQARGAEGDLRYDFGLVALKARSADGSWHDVLPIRPISRSGDGSAGPTLLRDDSRAHADGRRLTVAADGTVTVAGGFRDPRDNRWVRRGVAFRFEPQPCGVRMIVPTLAGDRYEWAAFLRHPPRANLLGDRLHELTFTPRPGRARGGAYASGTDARLTRVRLRFAPEPSSGLVITACSSHP